MSKSSAQTITCKAIVCWSAGEPVKVEEIQVEPPKSSEVRIKMLCASLCHTDVLCCKGFPLPLFPRVLGHEGVGMVESIGGGERQIICQTYPLQAFTGLMPDGTSRMSIGAQKLYHFLSCSTWSEYTVVDANYVVKIDSRIALPHASFISCGFATGFGAAWKEAKLQKGSSVAVLGLGAVGLGVIEGARVHWGS
ncbi:hypothetical protein F0562_031118 [Nyssa sinensis]|uniref:Alcohol dehydrogenase-like N-terminal domain-containing protein n=1 Tax=Nyssa sinensis TaxID=561372 RepID=A0A5J5ASZ6_9ASTE|nr:hypothetical protein F0562_031118 [Nyssa sinensis]